MNTNLLSFCCVSYNYEQYIEQCIKSIWNNDYNNIEILVLDDGSSDNSLEILYKLQKESPCPMTIIAQENCGCIGKNFNTLINKANGEFLSIIACDDALIENTLNEKMKDLISDDKLAFICNSKIIAIDEYGNSIENYCPMALDNLTNPTPNDLLNLDFNDIHSYYIQGSIFRTGIIKQLGGFDEDMICDDIILRTKLSRYLLQHSEFKFKVLHTPAVYYRRHSSNISKNILRQVKGVIEYFNKYWPDSEPPKLLYDWINDSLNTINNPDEFIEIFLKNKYVYKILKHRNYLNLLLGEGLLYKTIGIPKLLCLEKYKTLDKKIGKLKLFNVQIYQYTKSI